MYILIITGITQAEYLEARKKGALLPFICQPCRLLAVANVARDSTHVEGDDAVMVYSDISAVLSEAVLNDPLAVSAHHLSSSTERDAVDCPPVAEVLHESSIIDEFDELHALAEPTSIPDQPETVRDVDTF